MATKQEIAQRGQEQAALVIDNSFINGLTSQLQEKQKFGLSFPPDYNLANALNGAYLVLKDTVDNNKKPVLESCSKTSIANALMNMVTTGLDVNKKQGYFIAYGGKLNFQKSYFGNITIARRYGLKSINAEVIYEGDTFKYKKQDAMTIIECHEQDFMSIDVAKIKGVYAVAIMHDGTKISEIMNINQLKQAWNQRQGGLKEEANSTHVKFREEMAKKTVINRLCKKITNTYGDGYMIDITEELEKEENIDIATENVAYDVETKANTEEFIEADFQEVASESKTEAERFQESEEVPSFME